jgi:hypothetical protein
LSEGGAGAEGGQSDRDGFGQDGFLHRESP